MLAATDVDRPRARQGEATDSGSELKVLDGEVRRRTRGVDVACSAAWPAGARAVRAPLCSEIFFRPLLTGRPPVILLRTPTRRTGEQVAAA